MTDRQAAWLQTILTIVGSVVVVVVFSVRVEAQAEKAKDAATRAQLTADSALTELKEVSKELSEFKAIVGADIREAKVTMRWLAQRFGMPPLTDDEVK